MIDINDLSVMIFGLASAISWGAGDFTGGLATRRNNVYIVVIISQVAGVLLLFCMAILRGEPFPETRDLALGACAGFAGAIGLVILYRGLAEGRMGLVSPVAAIISAALPVVFGLLVEGLPKIQQLAGFMLAFLAVWLLSSIEDGARIPLSNLGLPIAAGIMFGLFFILMGLVSPGSVFWPLVAARLVSLSFLTLTAIVRCSVSPLLGRQLPLIVVAGILDAGGNILYTLAAQAGRIDIAAILAAMYPVATVLLARVVLKELLSIAQWAGLLVAFIAIILITS